MSKLTISDLVVSPETESFFTELNELNEPEMASLMTNIIGGCKIKFDSDGAITKIKNCSAEELAEIFV